MAGIDVMSGLPIVRIDLVVANEIEDRCANRSQSGARSVAETDRILGRLFRAAQLSRRDYEPWIIGQGNPRFVINQRAMPSEHDLRPVPAVQAVQSAVGDKPR